VGFLLRISNGRAALGEKLRGVAASEFFIRA
jgi:hypothetical protein